jgi:hypothetical protein
MLIVDLIKSEIQTDRFKFITKKYYDGCCAYTYSSVSKRILKFNPDKTDKVVSYVRVMIRCAFANWIGSNWEMLGYKKRKKMKPAEFYEILEKFVYEQQRWKSLQVGDIVYDVQCRGRIMIIIKQ